MKNILYYILVLLQKALHLYALNYVPLHALHMKKTILISLIFLLLSCSAPEKQISIMVSYPEFDLVSLFSSDLFSNVELVPLHGESAPIITSRGANLIVKNSIYYIYYMYKSPLGKVFLFDHSGTYMNSVGSIGKGPGEYTYFTDIVMEENGNISLFEQPNQTLYTFTPEGTCVSQTENLHPSASYAKLNGYQFHFFGHGKLDGRGFQLYIADSQNALIDSCLTAYNVMPIGTGTSVFSQYNQTLYLCPPEGGEVYRISSGSSYTPKVAHIFDFNKYAVPDEYFQIDNRSELARFISTRELAFKGPFFETQTHAALVTHVINYTNLSVRMLYGILDKKTDQWNWFFMKETTLMENFNLMYMDDTSIYFVAEPSEMKEAGLSKLFPGLNQISDYDNAIIFKCSLKN